MRKAVMKLEENGKKAGKKGFGLQEAIQQLNDKIKEEDALKGDKLRGVILIERKKYCNFINFLLPVISTGIEYHNEGMKMKANESAWKTLASSQNQLPDSIDALVNTQQNRTFVQVSSDSPPTSSNNNTLRSTPSFSNAPSNNTPPPPSNFGGPPPPPPMTGGPPPPPPPMTGGPPPPPPPMTGGPPPPPPPMMGSSKKKGPTCTALYDYTGEVDEDLSFSAGDVITITKPDDGSGWIEGELKGQIGIFPASYVEL